MIAAAKSISILWIPILGLPTIGGYIAGLWQRKQEHEQRVFALRRMLRRERQLADSLADELFYTGNTDNGAFHQYMNRRGRS